MLICCIYMYNFLYKPFYIGTLQLTCQHKYLYNADKKPIILPNITCGFWRIAGHTIGIGLKILSLLSLVVTYEAGHSTQ